MKKPRIVALVLACAMIAGAGGCKKKDASGEDGADMTNVSGELDGSGGNGFGENGDGSGDNGDGSGGNGSGDGSADESGMDTDSDSSDGSRKTSKDPSKITVGMPDDKTISGLASAFRKDGSILFACLGNGTYRSTDVTALSNGFSGIIAEYIFSAEYYQKYIQQAGKSKLSYDEFVEEMKKEMPNGTDLLDDDYKLKELPDERFFFSVSGRALHNQNIQPSQELIEEAIRRGMTILFEEPLCQAHFEKYIKMDELVYDMPYAYGITIVWVSETSAYIIVEGGALDSSKVFSKSEYVSLDGEPADLVVSCDSLMISTKGYAGNSRIQYNVDDAARAQALVDELQEFFEAHYDADGDGNGPWYDYNYMYTMDNDGNVVSVFCYDDTEMTFQYLGDGEWLYTDMFENKRTFTVADEAENRAMLERIYEEAAQEAFWKCGDLMTIVDGTWEIDWGSSSASDSGSSSGSGSAYGTSRMADWLKDANYQTLYSYIDDREFRSVFQAWDDNSLMVCQNNVRQTDAKVNGIPTTEDVYYYEALVEDGVAYARNDTTPEYYELADPGMAIPDTPFVERLAGCEFVGGYEVEFTEYPDDGKPENLAGDDAGYGFDKNGIRIIADATRVPAYCEVYRSGNGAGGGFGYDDQTIVILLTEEGNIIAGWEYGKQGLIVYYFIGLGRGDVDLSGDIAFAAENTADKNQQKKDDADKTAADWQLQDLTEHGFFDITGPVSEGDTYSSSPIVQGYIDYFQALEPFTLEMWTFGAFKVKEAVLSFDGKNFYDFDDVSSHDGSFDYDITRVLLGDTIYTSSSDGSQRVDQKGPEYSDAEILYSLPAIFIPTHTVTFQRAYNATLDGQSYIIEEWSYQGETFTFFCQDGEILAVKYREIGNMMYCYFAEFSKSADLDLIKKPW